MNTTINKAIEPSRFYASLSQTGRARSSQHSQQTTASHFTNTSLSFHLEDYSTGNLKNSTVAAKTHRTGFQLQDDTHFNITAQEDGLSLSGMVAMDVDNGYSQCMSETTDCRMEALAGDNLKEQSHWDFSREADPILDVGLRSGSDMAVVRSTQKRAGRPSQLTLSTLRTLVRIAGDVGLLSCTRRGAKSDALEKIRTQLLAEGINLAPKNIDRHVKDALLYHMDPDKASASMQKLMSSESASAVLGASLDILQGQKELALTKTEEERAKASKKDEEDQVGGKALRKASLTTMKTLGKAKQKYHLAKKPIVMPSVCTSSDSSLRTVAPTQAPLPTITTTFPSDIVVPNSLAFDSPSSGPVHNTPVSSSGSSCAGDALLKLRTGNRKRPSSVLDEDISDDEDDVMESLATGSRSFVGSDHSATVDSGVSIPSFDFLSYAQREEEDRRLDREERRRAADNINRLVDTLATFQAVVTQLLTADLANTGSTSMHGGANNQ